MPGDDWKKAQRSIRNHEPLAATGLDHNRAVPRRIIATGIVCTIIGLVLVTPLSILLSLILVAQDVLPYNADLKIYPWAVAVGTILCILGIAFAFAVWRFDGKSPWIKPLLVFNLLGLACSGLTLYTLLNFDVGPV